MAYLEHHVSKQVAKLASSLRIFLFLFPINFCRLWMLGTSFLQAACIHAVVFLLPALAIFRTSLSDGRCVDDVVMCSTKVLMSAFDGYSFESISSSMIKCSTLVSALRDNWKKYGLKISSRETLILFNSQQTMPALVSHRQEPHSSVWRWSLARIGKSFQIFDDAAQRQWNQLHCGHTAATLCSWWQQFYTENIRTSSIRTLTEIEKNAYLNALYVSVPMISTQSRNVRAIMPLLAGT